MKPILLIFALILSACTNTGSKTEDRHTCDSVAIYYVSPMFETFSAITPKDFIDDYIKPDEFNKLSIQNKDTVSLLMNARERIHKRNGSNYLDVRFMALFYSQEKIDTVLSSWPTPDILIDSILYEDSIYMNQLYKVIEFRDSIFPETRFEFQDGRIIMK